MPTRRDVLKLGGGAAVLAGLGAACPDSSTATPKARATTTLAAATAASASATPALPFRPGGAGKLYWSTYGYENSKNVIIPEAVWKANVDWVAENFRDYGY